MFRGEREDAGLGEAAELLEDAAPLGDFAILRASPLFAGGPWLLPADLV